MNAGIVSNNAQLTAIAALVGRANGYEDVQAEFSPFRDFKLKWTRSYRWISFEVSDYLQDAPVEIIRSLFDTVFARITGDENTGYSDEVVSYLTSEEYARRFQPVFVRRYRGLDTEDTDWIDESVDRLREKGLEVPEGTVFGTAGRGVSHKVGMTSVLMRVVAMNDAVADLPETARDYAVWSQIAHVHLGFNNGTERRDERAERYDSMLCQYPDRASQEAMLRAAELHL